MDKGKEVIKQRTFADLIEQVARKEDEIEKKKNEIQTAKRELEELKDSLLTLKHEEHFAELMNYKKRISRFVEKLRQHTAGLYGYESIVNKLFQPDSPCDLVHANDAHLPLELKREAIEMVLQETGLTEEEAKQLIKPGVQKNKDD